jgi:nitrous oxidase accessory protein
MLALSLALYANHKEGQEILVCPNCPFSKIQEAIDAADPGDVILIQTGTYKENLLITKPLTLRGEDILTTILQPLDPKAPTIRIRFASSVFVEGLTVEGPGVAGVEASMQEVGVQIENAEVTLYGNRIVNFTWGFKIYTFGPKVVVRENQVINRIIVPGGGGLGVGMLVLGSGEVHIQANHFSSLGTSLVIGGQVRVLMEGNRISGGKEGVVIGGFGHTILKGNEISNTMTNGIALDDRVTAEFWENVVKDNRGWGIAARVQECFPDKAELPERFQGQVIGEGNEIEGNLRGNLCPSYPGPPWPEGFKKEP